VSHQHPEQAASDPAEVIRVLALEDTDDRSLLRRPQDWRLGRAEVPVDVFRHRVSDFLESMRDVITGLPHSFGSYDLDEITVTAEVSASGQVSLLGSGGELAGKAGITFTFTRRDGAAPRPDHPEPAGQSR
jgi:hypothetical protein